MPNVNTFRNGVLAALGDDTGAKNVNEYEDKLLVVLDTYSPDNLATTINIASGTGDLAADDLQATIQDLADRIYALENP